MIIVDGKAYHANEHKEFVELKGDELSPYATVSRFTPDKTYSTSNKSSTEVYDEVKRKMLSENLFSAVKISGTFKNACTYDARTRATIYKID